MTTMTDRDALKLLLEALSEQGAVQPHVYQNACRESLKVIEELEKEVKSRQLGDSIRPEGSGWGMAYD